MAYKHKTYQKQFTFNNSHFTLIFHFSVTNGRLVIGNVLETTCSAPNPEWDSPAYQDGRGYGVSKFGAGVNYKLLTAVTQGAAL